MGISVVLFSLGRAVPKGGPRRGCVSYAEGASLISISLVFGFSGLAT